MWLLLIGLIFGTGAMAELPAYGIGSWPEAGFGNHRAVVRVTAPADAVWAHIEWRRRDQQPETKDIRVYDAATGQRVTNVMRFTVNRVFGDIVFQPKTVPGDYYVYYLPYNPPTMGAFGTGLGEPGTYLPPEDTADPAWVQKHGLPTVELTELPRAEVVEIQARGEFHRMDPMEVIATEQEVGELLARHPEASYLLFPESREHLIRMFEDLPYRWIETGPNTKFEGQAQPGEYYTFQIGVWAARESIRDLTVQLPTLVREGGGSPIDQNRLTCLNAKTVGGHGDPPKVLDAELDVPAYPHTIPGRETDPLGIPVPGKFALIQGRVRPLWIGIDVPYDAQGTYRGTFTIRPEELPPTTLEIALTIAGELLADHGDSDLWRRSRLRWLNSTLGRERQVIPPFISPKVDGRTVRLLGREIAFGETGLPQSIASNGREILATPMALTVESLGERVVWRRTRGNQQRSPTDVCREQQFVSANGGLELRVASKTEFDGCVSFNVYLAAKREIDLSEIRLDIPLNRNVVPYMMGMGKRGGLRPVAWRWKWDIERANNMVWLGDWNAGLQLKLLGEVNEWQLGGLQNTGLPDWANGGRGGCDITEEGDTVLVRAYTGERTLRAGDTLCLNFRLLITPFKPIDPRHWNWRYGDVKGAGTVCHVHHGVPQNPHINYPFLKADDFRMLVEQVESIRTQRTDFGELTYPAVGNLHPDRGALHIWTRVTFDPTAGSPGQAEYNQALFSLDCPNQDSLGFYWNIDDRGMRTYVRHGPPELNQYPILFGTHQPDWRQGQRHLLTLSWGNALAIFVDRQLAGAGAYKGTVEALLENAVLRFQGTGFAIDAIKIVSKPYTEGASIDPTVDEHTLLLDTFAQWDGGDLTRPEKSASPGQMKGVVEKSQGEHGPEIILSAREKPVPPKGVNIYYTVGQLSNHVAEMWALRSMGDEVFTNGGVDIYTDPAAPAKPAAGYAWLREHLVTGYEPAWRTVLGEDVDAAIGQQPLSRWHNYYVEGLRWLVEYTGLDGLYLDGIGYDRETMKRVARVMHRANPNYRINFHSGDNWSPPWNPDRRVSPANQYMEHFPYISNLWFGELYDYNMPPDYWLVEISGIPFGLTGEMLNYENGGNPYRGMVYAMSGRQHPSCTAMWAFWDQFGIAEAEMLGYWDHRCPVRTDREDVLATVYRKANKALIALAHWPSRRAQPQASVQRSAAPVIDGTLAPEEWNDAARLARFTVFQSDVPPANATTVYLMHDGERLYIGFRCEQAGTPKAEVMIRDGDVWTDDAIELFIQPDPEPPLYYQFVGNSRGVVADGQNMDLAWNGPWEYRAVVGEGFWSGEMSIPFTSLGMEAPIEGHKIGFNVCRDQQRPHAQATTWAPVRQTFHEPDNFGRLTFSDQPATREEPASAPDPQQVSVRLRIDWQALGIDAQTARLTAPPLAHFQERAEFDVNEPIPVDSGKGWLLILEQP
ncbi:MAG: glycoside hydrolase domain-containing protein [Candidatus Zipacnadales bacterium]